MATPEQIAEVRENVDEPTDTVFKDAEIEGFVDTVGVERASAILWRKKASRYSSLVNVSEAGSSHALGDLQAKALAMAKEFDAMAVTEEALGPVVSVIDRS